MAHEQYAQGRFAPPGDALDHATGVALYAQLAGIFRHQILSGAWGPGHRLDNFDALATQYGVARITVRQAVARLVDEGLLSTQRRRGTVVREGRSQRVNGPISTTGIWPEDLRIEVVYKGKATTLPHEFVGSFLAAPRYVEISKIHAVHAQPIAMVRVFVDEAVFRRFARNAIEKQKILRLVFAHGNEAATEMHQRMTVEPADPLVAKVLQCTIGSPIAKITRQIYGIDRRLSYAGISWYRGDTFEMDMVLPRGVVVDSSPAFIAPRVRSVCEDGSAANA